MKQQRGAVGGSRKATAVKSTSRSGASTFLIPWCLCGLMHCAQSFGKVSLLYLLPYYVWPDPTVARASSGVGAQVTAWRVQS